MNITFCVVRTTERLDRFLADQLALSRTQAGRLIADKRVTARGKPLRASALLEPGTEVAVALPDADTPSYWPVRISSTIWSEVPASLLWT